jgi:hypothetical protein
MVNLSEARSRLAALETDRERLLTGLPTEWLERQQQLAERFEAAVWEFVAQAPPISRSELLSSVSPVVFLPIGEEVGEMAEVEYRERVLATIGAAAEVRLSRIESDLLTGVRGRNGHADAQ